eukprot:scaffold13896_cov120-Isochrysis_galbana.AAC.1
MRIAWCLRLYGIWEYPYGWPAREACCLLPPQGPRCSVVNYFAGPWQSSARLSACELTAK